MIPQNTYAPAGPSEALCTPQVILRLPAVLKARGLSRSTHYLSIQQGLFTKPVALGDRAVGWPEQEVATLNAARIAGMSSEDLRALVIRLEARRNACVK